MLFLSLRRVNSATTIGRRRALRAIARLETPAGPRTSTASEGRQEDRLQRDDHRQQAEGVLLDPETDPAAEPDDVQVNERHRAGEGGDAVGDPVLDVLRALLRVLQRRRVERAPRRER